MAVRYNRGRRKRSKRKLPKRPYHVSARVRYGKFDPRLPSPYAHDSPHLAALPMAVALADDSLGLLMGTGRFAWSMLTTGNWYPAFAVYSGYRVSTGVTDAIEGVVRETGLGAQVVTAQFATEVTGITVEFFTVLRWTFRAAILLFALRVFLWSRGELGEAWFTLWRRRDPRRPEPYAHGASQAGRAANTQGRRALVGDPDALARAALEARRQVRESALRSMGSSTSQASGLLGGASEQYALVARESGYGRPLGEQGCSGGAAGAGPVAVAPPRPQSTARARGGATVGASIRRRDPDDPLDLAEGHFEQGINDWTLDIAAGDRLRFRYTRGFREGVMRPVRVLELLNTDRAFTHWKVRCWDPAARRGTGGELLYFRTEMYDGNP